MKKDLENYQALHFQQSATQFQQHINKSLRNYKINLILNIVQNISALKIAVK